MLRTLHTNTRYWAAILAQLVLLAYFELCVVAPLGDWNAHPVTTLTLSDANISEVNRAGELLLGAVMGGFQLLLLAGTVWRLKPLLWVGLIGDTAWLIPHILSLWVPYVRGALPNYAFLHYHIYGNHPTNLLPSFGTHLAPDGLHTVLDVLLVVVVVTLVRYLRSLRPQLGLAQERRNT